MGRTNELNAKLNSSASRVTASVRDAFLAIGSLESAPLVAAALSEVGVLAVAVPPTEVFDTCDSGG
jgi:hypothetical protein